MINLYLFIYILYFKLIQKNNLNSKKIFIFFILKNYLKIIVLNLFYF